MLYVEFPDAQEIAAKWLRPRLVAPGLAGSVSTEPPGPDELPDLVPLLVIFALPSPPLINRYALAPSRLYFAAIAADQPTANRIANKANAHIRALSGQTVELVEGLATVSRVANVAMPDSGDDENPGYRTSAFSGELYLRPLRARP